MKKSLELLEMINKISKRKFKNLIAVTGIVTALTILLGLSAFSYSDSINKDISDNLIRLHVVANSDSDDDQELKRHVRDDILILMEDKLKESKNIEESKKILLDNMDQIQETAQKRIDIEGKNYNAEPVLGEFQFPTKVYGDIALPAGKYQALKVVLGNGEGANWWCVLFPPLCFIDATHGEVPESVKDDLKKVLSEDEYKLVTTADNDEDIPIKVKFKIVEIFQESKVKFSGFLNR